MIVLAVDFHLAQSLLCRSFPLLSEPWVALLLYTVPVKSRYLMACFSGRFSLHFVQLTFSFLMRTGTRQMPYGRSYQSFKAHQNRLGFASSHPPKCKLEKTIFQLSDCVRWRIGLSVKLLSSSVGSYPTRTAMSWPGSMDELVLVKVRELALTVRQTHRNIV